MAKKKQKYTLSTGRVGEEEYFSKYMGLPSYKPYGEKAPVPELGELPEAPKKEPYPEITPIPTYKPTTEAYPITQLPTYKPTEKAYPEYGRPETGGITTQLQETIGRRMRGEGTAGAESAIYERGESRVQREYEEGLKRIDEQMSARGLTGSGIHGEAVRKLEEERQRSLADLSRQITIYGQKGIESAMARGQQYVEYQSAEAARELAAKERGYGARIRERTKAFESKAKAAEARGASEQAAYNTAIAERIKAFESKAKAATAKNDAQYRKWQAKTNDYLQRYRLEMEKAQMMQRAKMQAYEIGREEYRRKYEAEYARTKDRYLAEVAAKEAARKKANDEWTKEKYEIERRDERRRAYQKTFESQYEGAYGGLEGYDPMGEAYSMSPGSASYYGAGYSEPAPSYTPRKRTYGTPTVTPRGGR